MKQNKGFVQYIPYFVAIFTFLVITFLYFSPLLSGKTISMHDYDMSMGNAKALADFYEETGEYSWWTNSVFAGMPSNMIYGAYPNSLSSGIGSFLYKALPIPANVIFLLMVGFFVFMIALRQRVWVSIITSIAFAFGTYNLLYTEAGHISKILAIAFAPGIIGGFALLFRKKYWLGTFITALFLSLEIYANHLQITYYFIFVLFAYYLYHSIQMLKKGESKSWLKISSLLALAVIIGVSSHSMRLWNNYVYSKETTRGSSELSQSSAGNQGLDRDYAFAWSYGIDETFNLIVPDLMGGGSSGALSDESETFKVLTSNGVDRNMAKQFVSQLPLYFGKQPFTSGPAYSGILIVFLFVLGLFINHNKFKWYNLGLIIFFIVLAWGDNFTSFNYAAFDYLPGYNKFRAVTMSLVVVHFLLVWAAAEALVYLIDKKLDWEALKKPLIYSLGIITGLMLIGYFTVDFTGPADQNFKNSLAQSSSPEFANKILFALQDDRKSMATKDILRGIFLLGLFSTGIWVYFNKKARLKSRMFYAIAFLLITFDLVGVGKRYFNNEDFAKRPAVPFTATAIDQEILKDNDPNFKVLNLTTSFSNDSRDSYFHKSIGGYHGAKLKKTQELLDHQFTDEEGRLNMEVLNMLNTKYLITNGPEGPELHQNPEALGNAWFIKTLKVVPNADEELSELGSFEPSDTAVTQQNQGLETKSYPADSASTINLIGYAPNRLMYSTHTSQPEYAVFSEIYYRGNQDWKSYIDGQEVPHQKVNYLLRGIEVPAGKHQIVFEFLPRAVSQGKKLDLIGSIGLILLGLGAVYSAYRKKQ